MISSWANNIDVQPACPNMKAAQGYLTAPTPLLGDAGALLSTVLIVVSSLCRIVSSDALWLFCLCIASGCAFAWWAFGVWSGAPGWGSDGFSWNQKDWFVMHSLFSSKKWNSLNFTKTPDSGYWSLQVMNTIPVTPLEASCAVLLLDISVCKQFVGLIIGSEASSGCSIPSMGHSQPF